MMKVFGWIGIVLFALTVLFFIPLGWLMESTILNNIGIVAFCGAIINLSIGIILNESRR